MILNFTIIFAVVAIGLVLFSPGVVRLPAWRATITPLASIIGSGFLVLGPILDYSYGKFAPLVMAGLCLAAYLYGSAIRYNITEQEKSKKSVHWAFGRLETISSAALAFAYVISVTYYLNLFGAFGVSLTEANTPTDARLLTSAVFAIILFAGWTGGFKSLEKFEYVSVALKLAIISGLLVGLAAYFLGKTAGHALVLNPPTQTGWPALALAGGLIVTVQGFETSRYLGEEYDAEIRRRSMRWAQWLSTAIYMVYILLLAYVFDRGELRFSETAIVDMMKLVAPILPALLVAAALAAQFSAAVADTSGSGGLFAELTKGWLSPRSGYVILVAIGLALTWSANIFQIISYASRAFAVYYCLQALIATAAAHGNRDWWRSCLFAFLAALGVAIVLFGRPIEG